MSLSDMLLDKNRYDLQFRGMTGKEKGVIFSGYPDFTYGKVKYETTKVNGKIGDFVKVLGGRENTKISCTFAIVSDEIQERIRDLQSWLSGSGVLKFSDRPDCFYEVKLVDSADFQRKSRKYGVYTVGFLIYPYEFLEDGEYPYTPSVLTCNPYAECMPTYVITGNGSCVLNVNGNEFRVNVPERIYIDSRRMISYKEDHSSANILVAGDYEDLYLPNGDVNITITEGYDLQIIPHWGWFS